MTERCCNWVSLWFSDAVLHVKVQICLKRFRSVISMMRCTSPSAGTLLPKGSASPNTSRDLRRMLQLVRPCRSGLNGRGHDNLTFREIQS